MTKKYINVQFTLYCPECKKHGVTKTETHLRGVNLTKEVGNDILIVENVKTRVTMFCRFCGKVITVIEGWINDRTDPDLGV